MGLSYFGDLALSLTIGYIGVFGFLCAAQMINHELFTKRSRNNEMENENEENDGNENTAKEIADECEPIELLEKLDEVLKESKIEALKATGTIEIFDGPSTSKAAVSSIFINQYNKSNENDTELSKKINEIELNGEKYNVTKEIELAIELSMKEANAELAKTLAQEISFIEGEKKAEEHSRSKRSIENEAGLKIKEPNSEENNEGMTNRIDDEPNAELIKLNNEDCSSDEPNVQLTQLLHECEENSCTNCAIETKDTSELEIDGENGKEDEERSSEKMDSTESEDRDEDQNQPDLNDDAEKRGVVENMEKEMKGLEIRTQLYVSPSLDLFAMAENYKNNIELQRKGVPEKEEVEEESKKEVNS